MKRIENQIKKLLEKENLTGDDVGRVMILDLVAAYNDLSDGGEGVGILSDDEKISIVNRLTFSGDIQRFNDFRGVHDFLTTAPAVYDSYKKTYEVYYWRLVSLVTNMRHAEDEYFFVERSPVIMTQERYARFLEDKEPVPVGGIAVLQELPGTPPYSPEDTRPLWRERYCAEKVLSERSAFVNEALSGMKDMLAECMARKKALELIARYIKLPQVKMLLPEIENDKIVILNDLMFQAVSSVNRNLRGKGYEIEIKEKLYALFTPLYPDELSPLPGDVAKARRSLNYSVIKNGSEAFIASLKRKWRE